MNATASYPTKYKNLLIEAGLIGTGERIVKALVTGNKTTTLDEQSDTWVESDEFETDFRGSAEYFCPVLAPGGIISGDWRHGLDTEQIKRIQQDCGVPVYEPNTMIYIYDGKRYDLSNPAHMAEYRIVERGVIIAPNRSTLQAGQRFYFVSTEEVEKEKRKVRELKVQAVTLANTLDVEEKRQMLEMANWRFKLGHASGMSDQQVREVFMDLALGEHYPKIIEIYSLPGKRFYATFYSCLDHGILVSDGVRGAVSYPGSKEPLAIDHDAFVQLLMRDNNLFLSLQERLNNVKNVRLETVILPEKVALVRTYDTTIHEEGDVGLWGLGACKQYVREKGWNPVISDADGVEKWRKLVLDIYNDRSSPYGELPVVQEKNATLTLRNMDWAKKQVSDWRRDECKAFLDEHKEEAESLYFEHQLNNSHATEKWRTAVLDFLSLLSQERVVELLSVNV